MGDRPAFPRRFRRRLTVGFVLAAGLAAATVSAAGFLAARSYRLQAFADRALERSESNLALVARELAASGGERPAALDAHRDVFETLVLSRGRAFASHPALGADDVPPALRAAGGSPELASARTDVAGVPHLVVGATTGEPPAEVYFFFPQGELVAGLAELRDTLLGASVAVTAAAALAGNAVARRTLRPVRAAADAAHSVAEGLLGTRLAARTDDEFGAWAGQFNEMAEALEQKIRALAEARDRERRFTADVAHELRTPLGALVGAASLLQEHLDEMPAEARRPAELVVGGARRLRRLVEDLMELSRLDAGHEATGAEPVELGAAVAAAVRAHGWDATVALEAAEPVAVTTDRRRLDRVVVNLLANAVEHGGRNVRARVRREDGAGVVEVADEGPGIPPGDLPRIFDRFHKADPARSRGGSGLGLAIARESAELLGGTLGVRSEPGTGTCFTLRLPPAGRPTVARDGAAAPSCRGAAGRGALVVGDRPPAGDAT